jgi:hypothetical protein
VAALVLLVVELLVEVVPVELVPLDELPSELLADVEGGGGGGGPPCPPPMADARSWILGRLPDEEALLKSVASVVSSVAWAVFPSDVAVVAAVVRLVEISDITDLYSVGSDCCRFWSVVSNWAKGESWLLSDDEESSEDRLLRLLVDELDVLLVELVPSMALSSDCR